MPGPSARPVCGAKASDPAIAVEHRRAIAADRHPRIDLERTDGAHHRRALDVLHPPIRPEDDALTNVDIHATAGAARHFYRHHDHPLLARTSWLVRRNGTPGGCRAL